MHIRYSDDILFFGKTKEEVRKARKIASEYLSKLNLNFNYNKTYLSDINKGFEYLGIFFIDNNLMIDTTKLANKAKKLYTQTKNLNLKDTIIKLNEKVTGFNNYYAKLIDDSSQLKILQDKLEEIIIKKIIQAKKSKEFTTKKELKTILEPLQSYDTKKNHSKWINTLISIAYEQISLEKPLKEAKEKVRKQKYLYLKEQIKSSELVVSQTGAFLGFSQGKIKVKLKGKVVAQAPINKIKRVILLNKQISISTYLIYECSKRKIDIDFIYQSTPYAMLTYYNHIMPKVHLAQLKAYISQRGFGYAKEIAHSKARNQINLLKYLNRRRKDNFISNKIEIMISLHNRIKQSKNKNTLMGLEGKISAHYWNAFGKLVGVNGFIRTHQNSKDPINQALNYGYAILYNRVQSALIHEGLNLYYPLYHALKNNKPTLVYDMIESFRQPIVDREILSIINRGQKITQVNGLLSKDSIKLIVQNIQERLATPTPSRYGKTPLYNIISLQANHLKQTLLNGSTYKGFVNKY